MCQTSTACRSLSTAHGGNVAWLPINMTGFLARDTSSTPRWTDTHTHTQHAVDNPTTTATCHPNCHLAHSSTDSIYSSKWNLERNTSGLFSQPPLFTPSLPSLYLLLSPFLPFHLLALPFHFNHPPCLPLILPLPFSSPCYSLTPFTLTQPLPPHSFFYCPSTFLSHLPLSLTPSFLTSSSFPPSFSTVLSFNPFPSLQFPCSLYLSPRSSINLRELHSQFYLLFLYILLTVHFTGSMEWLFPSCQFCNDSAILVCSSRCPLTVTDRQTDTDLDVVVQLVWQVQVVGLQLVPRLQQTRRQCGYVDTWTFSTNQQSITQSQ